jgi:hypothetical protein
MYICMMQFVMDGLIDAQRKRAMGLGEAMHDA